LNSPPRGAALVPLVGTALLAAKRIRRRALRLGHRTRLLLAASDSLLAKELEAQRHHACHERQAHITTVRSRIEPQDPHRAHKRRPSLSRRSYAADTLGPRRDSYATERRLHWLIARVLTAAATRPVGDEFVERDVGRARLRMLGVVRIKDGINVPAEPAAPCPPSRHAATRTRSTDWLRKCRAGLRRVALSTRVERRGSHRRRLERSAVANCSAFWRRRRLGAFGRDLHGALVVA
jgi:hypothetical protein